MNKNHVGVYLWAPIVLAVGMPQVSVAQQDDDSPFEEITVAATKTVTAFSAGHVSSINTDERYTNARLNTGDYILSILSNDAS